MPLSEASLAAWLFAFARLAGWAVLDPLTGRLPLRMRLFLAAVLAAVLVPGLAINTVLPFTVQGMLALSLEGVWGAALALCVWLVFAAVTAGLAWTGHTATGGLLTLTAERADTADAAWRALAGWLAALAFLGASGHLLVVDALRHSFTVMPAAVLPGTADLRALAEAAGWLFATGVQLALPLLALALLIQLAFGIVARTTPGLDMFSAGLGIAALGLMAAWVLVVPLITHGVGLGIEQLAGWLGRFASRSSQAWPDGLECPDLSLTRPARRGTETQARTQHGRNGYDQRQPGRDCHPHGGRWCARSFRAAPPGRLAHRRGDEWNRRRRHNRRVADGHLRRALHPDPGGGRAGRRAGAGDRGDGRQLHRRSDRAYRVREACRRPGGAVGGAVLQQADPGRPLPALQENRRSARPTADSLQCAGAHGGRSFERHRAAPGPGARHRRLEGCHRQHGARGRPAAPCAEELRTVQWG